MNAHLLQVTRLRKTYPARRSLFRRSPHPTVAVDDVSFAIGRGETLALVGESGAGKSTVGRLVLRLVEADSGEICFDGQDLRALPKRDLRAARRGLQVIFQDPHGSLDPRVPIGESVAEPLLIHFEAPRRARLAEACALLERVGLHAEDANRLPGGLSGGQLQRVAIARALALKPDLIVCDEPVAALDVSVRAQVLNLMTDLQNEFGLAYLFISHDLALVEVIADRVAVMRNGVIVEHGTVTDIFQRPVHPYTRELLAAIPRPIPRSTRV